MEPILAASPALHRRPPEGWKLWLLLACLACCSALSWAAVPQPSGSESAIKAAFLHRIIGLVEWPSGTFSDRDEPLVIAVAGADALAADLERTVAERSAEGRPVAVRRLGENDAPTGAHVLMVGATREARVRELSASPGPLLVVTEQDQGHRLGGVLNFTVENQQVRFTASLPQADARGLRLSSRLLAVAHAVERRVP